MRGLVLLILLIILVASSYMKGYGDGMDAMITRYNYWLEAMSQWADEMCKRSDEMRKRIEERKEDGQEGDSGSVPES